MQVDLITPDMLATILPWWEERGEGLMPADVLPPRGFVASLEGVPLAAAWIYEPVGCPVILADWLVSRPRMSAHLARRACRAVFERIDEVAREVGATRILASVSSSAMAREAGAVGFVICSAYSIHIAKSL